jgi:hypothetical protein
VAMEERGIEEKSDQKADDDLPPITSDIATQALILIHELSTAKIAAQPPKPEPDPKKEWGSPPPEPLDEDDARWPITKPIREAIIVSALDLCGVSVTPGGDLQPHGQPPETPRVVLGAMRILAAFDLLAIRHKRLRYLGVSFKLLDKRRRAFKMDPEIELKVNTFLHEERVKLRDQRLAEKAAALATESA